MGRKFFIFIMIFLFKIIVNSRVNGINLSVIVDLRKKELKDVSFFFMWKVFLLKE